MDISKATERNWRRLNADPSHRLSARANKTRSCLRFIPKERCALPGTVAFIESILPFGSEYSVEDILYSLCCSLLTAKNVSTELKAQFEAEYSHLSEISELAALTLPEEFDILGTVYQSLLTEGAKNKAGSYYTPKKIADTLLSAMAVRAGQNFIDPCCGSGTFLILAFRRGCRIKGIDVDPTAVMIAKANLLAEGVPDYPDVLCSDFKTYEPDSSEHYDCSASNPPWGKGCSKGFSDISCEFFLKTHRLLRDGGKINFLLPFSLLNVACHKNFREHFLSQGKAEEIRLFGSDFSGVQTSCFSALMVKTAPAESLRIIDKHGVVRSVPVSVYEFTAQKNIFNADPKELSALKKILSLGSISLSSSMWGLGIVTGDNKTHLRQEPEEGLEPIYTGKEIKPFYPEAPKNFIKFDRKKFQQTAKDEVYRTRPKLIYKFISSRPVFALDETGNLVLNSANVLIPRDIPFSAEALLALLNSDAFAFAHRVLFGEVKFLQGNLVPIKLPVLSAEADQLLNLLVRRLKKEPRVLESINEFIFELYGLSEEERKAVTKRLSVKKSSGL